MIIFLTLCYIGILALLVKFKVIKLTLWWKLSPLVWLIFLLIVLFIPMQWGAPSGAVTMYQHVVEIVPNVTGEVIEVPVKQLEPLKKGDVLFKIDPVPYQAKVKELKARLKLASIRLKQSRELARRQAGSVYEVEQYEAEVASLTAQLERAEYDLSNTVVRAPSEGFLMAMTLLPGQRVSNLPLRSWMTFVDQESTILVMGVNQNSLRFVEPGQRAEVVLKLFPGKALGATVTSIGYMTAQGQWQPSGIAPIAPTGQEPPGPYGVVLNLDDDMLKLHNVPGGAMGIAAIYTNNVKMTHIIRKVIIRLNAWLNYVVPY